jgi:hypothetical protein
MGAKHEHQIHFWNNGCYHCPLVTVLDPNTDDKSIEMTGKSCNSVDHQTASEFAEEYPKKDFPVKGLKEILGPDDQFYGYIIIWDNQLVSACAALAEDKALRIYPNYVPYGGP